MNCFSTITFGPLTAAAVDVDGSILEITFWRFIGWKVILSRLRGGRRFLTVGKSETSVEAALDDLERTLALQKRDAV